MQQIDLNNYRNPDIDILSGRDKGEWVRSELKIDSWDSEEFNVTVHTPPELTVTTSFYLGLLSNSIKNLGEYNFRDKYTFTGKDIKSKIEYCINVSLKRNSPF